MQPSFWCVANIGDVNPLDHGGAFVLVDRRGNYCPELWILEPVGEDSSGEPVSWELHTVLMEECTFYRDESNNAVLSDNKYHPSSQAWFANGANFALLASYIGQTVDCLGRLFTGTLLERAIAWKAVYYYHGSESGPYTLDRQHASELCNRMLHQLKESESWHDGTRAPVGKS